MTTLILVFDVPAGYARLEEWATPPERATELAPADWREVASADEARAFAARQKLDFTDGRP